MTEPTAKSASRESEAGSKIPATKYLLSGLGALQAVIVAVGASNGALVTMAINKPWLLGIGVTLVVVAVVIGVAVNHGADKRWDVLKFGLTFAGSVALLGGLGITGYAALYGPSIAKAPDVDVTLGGTPGRPELSGEVKGSGIPAKAHYWVEVDARKYVLNQGVGAYSVLSPPLYQAQLGVDSQGNIDEKFSLPLVGLRRADAVSVEAWFGDHAGPCGSLTVPGGANLTGTPPRKIAATNTPVGQAAQEAEAKARSNPSTSSPAAVTAAAQHAILAKVSRPGCAFVRLH